MTITENFLKTYTDRTYQHTTMIRHNGRVVAFAMDQARRIYYSVLNFDDDKQDSPLDVNYWLENPRELNFPNEISQVGYAIAGSTMMPIVKKASRQEAQQETLRIEEIDPFLSSTARLTADAPFQTLSDEKYIYLFRQSIEPTHEDMVFKTDSGVTSGDSERTDYVEDSNGNKVPIVKDTLLVDRFILAGTQLKPKMEVRYQRSRHKTNPLGSKDSLGAKDMEGKPFFEPTQELDFVCHLQQGRFSVLLLPTEISGVQRWQVFAHNSHTGLIDSFNVERAADGLFNTKGTQYYTSPDSEYQKSVFERQPGKCPFTDEDLIPLVSKEGYAESALEFDGNGDYVEVPYSAKLNPNQFTISCWVKVTGGQSNYRSVITSRNSSSSLQQGYTFYAGSDNKWQFWVGDGNSWEVIKSTDVVLNTWTHLAGVYNGTKLQFYINGTLVDELTTIFSANSTRPLRIGSGTTEGNPRYFLPAQIDEVRIWNRARTGDEIKADMNHRLIGDEPGLVGYWRFDEGSGNTVHDQTENANHGTIHGNPTWVNSDAPVGDHPGIRRTNRMIILVFQ